MAKRKKVPVAAELISGSLKRSDSYHTEYGGLTYEQLCDLANAKPPDIKARQMKKLIDQSERLRAKVRGKKR